MIILISMLASHQIRHLVICKVDYQSGDYRWSLYLSQRSVWVSMGQHTGTHFVSPRVQPERHYGTQDSPEIIPHVTTVLKVFCTILFFPDRAQYFPVIIHMSHVFNIYYNTNTSACTMYLIIQFLVNITTSIVSAYCHCILSH